MFRALAARHSALLSLLPAAVCAAEPAAGAVPPLAAVRDWLGVGSHRAGAGGGGGAAVGRRQVLAGDRLVPAELGRGVRRDAAGGQDERQRDLGQALLLGRGRRRGGRLVEG